MGIVNGTGKASCSVCQQRIPQGARCVHHHVNSRAAPYICESCIATWHRLLTGKSHLELFDVCWIGKRSENEYKAKRRDIPGWICDIHINNKGLVSRESQNVIGQIAAATGLDSTGARVSGSTHVDVDGQSRMATTFAFEVIDEEIT